MNKQPLTLYELNSLVREVIDTAFTSSYWVEAEVAEIRESHGHCFMQLIQKDSFQHTPIARADAKCWAKQWFPIKLKFEDFTGQPITAGMKVLLCVTPQFHEAYGFSWFIEDIDPIYTLGDMAKKRADIIAQLKAEGVFDMQKDLTLPHFAQRIAVISSDSAAGYGDFCDQLHHNPYHFIFTTELFSATMQGENTQESIIQALNRIHERINDFDLVVIIRGGGATSDLSGFDTLELAENVANYPLPIITGIGHQRDESILDLIAFRSMKTPTAVAVFLIDHLLELYQRISSYQDFIIATVEQKIMEERNRLKYLTEKVPMLFGIASMQEQKILDKLANNLQFACEKYLAIQRQNFHKIQLMLPHAAQQNIILRKHKLQLLSQKIHDNDPQLLLQKGYSMTLHAGKIVKDASTLQKGDSITTILKHGKIESQVQ